MEIDILVSIHHTEIVCISNKAMDVTFYTKYISCHTHIVLPKAKTLHKEKKSIILNHFVTIHFKNICHSILDFSSIKKTEKVKYDPDDCHLFIIRLCWLLV